jgi:hypothetical protein
VPLRGATTFDQFAAEFAILTDWLTGRGWQFRPSTDTSWF